MLDNWIQVVKKPKREAQGRGEVRNDNKRGGRGKRASYASTIIGKATGLHIRAAKCSAHIFVSRLDPGLRCDELADHLESVLHLRPTVELIKATDTYASFRLSCEFQYPNVFLDANIWPEGSLVRWWREQRTNMRATPLEPNRNEYEATRLSTFSRDASTSAGITAVIVATVDDDENIHL